jgi:serine/threonine protein phosphatase PrpC
VAIQTAVQKVTSELPGTSFSMTAGLLFGEIVILGHLGSASAYIVDHHHIEQITNVQTSSEEGSSDQSPSGFKQSQQSGGSSSEELSSQVSVYSRPIPRDGYILLCTQGLTDVIPEYDIQRIVLELQEPQSICDGLVHEAHRRKDGTVLSTVALHFPPDF